MKTRNKLLISMLAMLVYAAPSPNSRAQAAPAPPAHGRIMFPSGPDILGREEKTLPAGLAMSNDDINVTKGAAGYVFTVKGKRRFVISEGQVIKIRLPFSAAGIPAADTKSGVKIFVRLFNQKDHPIADLTGDIEIAGSTGTITVETPGLPSRFTAVVIYNPNMESAASP